MKLHILCACITMLFFGNAAFAQCDLHKKTDEFTGQSTVWTKRIKITRGGMPVILKNTNGDCTYKIYFKLIATNGKTYIAMTEDADNCYCMVTNISFKFSDGKVLIQNKYRKGEETKTPLGAERYTFFEISKDDLTELSASVITKFRLNDAGCTDHPVIEEDMENRDAADIKAMSACLLKASKEK